MSAELAYYAESISWNMLQGDRGGDGRHGIPGSPGPSGQTLMVSRNFSVISKSVNQNQ